MKTVIIGGGSFTWSFGFVRQFVNSDIKDLTVALVDTNPQALELVKTACDIYNKSFGCPIKIETGFDTELMLDGADFVIVSISTGGLQAMKADLEIPEKYGIWHTVGDTVGPGGWSRAVRNIPVFYQIAKLMKEKCPNAWLINVTNPLTVLTRVPEKYFGIKTIGMCPGVEEQARTLVQTAGLPASTRIDFINTGVDHHSYFINLYADGQDVLEILRHKGFFRPDGILPDKVETVDPLAENAINRAIFAIWYDLGYLPSIPDRHSVENYSNFILNDTGVLPYGIKRTSIKDRIGFYGKAHSAITNYIEKQGKDGVGSLGHGDDPVVKVIEALYGKESFIWCSNYKNIGQIPDLPANSIVETRCLFDKTGVQPLVSPMPDILKSLVLPQAYRQEAILDIAINGTFDQLIGVVMSDPLCSRLLPGKVREMMKEMLTVNKQYIKNPYLLEF